jgi:hypothetical protein
MKVYVIHAAGFSFVPAICKTKETAERILVDLTDEYSADHLYIEEYEVVE